MRTMKYAFAPSTRPVRNAKTMSQLIVAVSSVGAINAGWSPESRVRPTNDATSPTATSEFTGHKGLTPMDPVRDCVGTPVKRRGNGSESGSAPQYHSENALTTSGKAPAFPTVPADNYPNVILPTCKTLSLKAQ